MLFRLIKFCCCVFIIFASVGCLFATHPSKIKPAVIAITQIIEHPSLDKIRKGVLDTLKNAGYREGENCRIILENAHGDISVATQIAQKLVSSEADVIIAITTPSAQSVLQAAKNTGTPVVFGAVTDPLEARLVDSLEAGRKARLVTGTIDSPEASRQLDEICKLLPQLRTLAVIYNTSETNSVAQIKKMKIAAQQRGITLIFVPALKTADVSPAARLACERLATTNKNSAAIFIPNDNTVVSALDTITGLASQKGIPVFTSDPESVERGALAAFANDQYVIGQETGKLVVQILKGKSPGDIPVKVVSNIRSYINAEKARKLGLK